MNSLGGDLAVAPAGCDQLGDLSLRRSERVAIAARPAADPTELAPRTVAPDPSAHLIEESLRLVESLARSAAVLRAPVGHAEREQRASALERDGESVMDL